MEQKQSNLISCFDKVLEHDLCKDGDELESKEVNVICIEIFDKWNWESKTDKRQFHPAGNSENGTCAIASIMSRPISTQQLAWSGRGSGNPLTQ